MVREVIKNPIVTDRDLEFLCGDGRTLQKDNHLCSAPPIRPYSRVAIRKLLLSKRHMTVHLEFAKRNLKTQTMRNIIWSETKIELFGLNAKSHVWRKPGTIPMAKHGYGSIMLLGCFSVAGTGRLVRIKANMNGAKFREP
uniref:Uncharacterized protein n=1 Tax=Oncorhynchus tshawytscha TaxID=74940 RepID=A0AAZ3REA1_ONCTS